MGADQSVTEQRIAKFLEQLEALQSTREDLFRRLNEELASSHVYARSMNGHLYAWDAQPSRSLMDSLAGVCEMHAGVLREYELAVTERERIAALPIGAQAAVAGLKLLPGGSL